MSPRRLVLFTKPAVPGRVKTRLVGELSPEGAAELHRAFLDDLAERLRAAEARGAFELWAAWALEEGEALPPGPGRPIRQEGKDLGERLFRGLARAADGGGAVAALGSDHPTVPLEAVEEAFRRLAAGADLVLGPSRDGGYYLIALTARSGGALRRELFEGIAWSTDRVLGETLERAASLGLRTELLDEGTDVDTPEDLRRLAAGLAEDPGLAALCPRTADLMASWGYLLPVPQEAL